MVSPRPRLFGAVFGAAALMAITSCAAVWGYEPLTLAPDDPDDADVDAAGDDASIDHNANSGDSNATTEDASPKSDAPIAVFDAGGGDSGNPGTDAAPSTLTCLSTNGTCICNADGTGNTAPCSPTAVGIDPANMICCADPSYPSNGQCTCDWIGCTTSNNTCICGPQNNAPGGSCAAQSWTCCLQTGASECICSASACMTGFTEFGNSCAVKDVKCAAPSHRVAACR